MEVESRMITMLRRHFDHPSKFAVEGALCKMLTDDGRRCAVGQVAHELGVPDSTLKYWNLMDNEEVDVHEALSPVSQKFIRQVRTAHDLARRDPDRFGYALTVIAAGLTER